MSNKPIVLAFSGGLDTSFCVPYLQERGWDVHTVFADTGGVDAEERAFWTRVIEKGDQNEGDLAQALALMARHGALEATRAEALAWSERARHALRLLPEHPLREMLSDLADYVVARLR